ncbi:MAG: heavy metal-associated domain-containing protein [Eggerthellaceae bacterium]|jgi:copper chaperone
MNIGTLVILIIVIAICIPAARHMVKVGRGDGGCCGGGGDGASIKKVKVADRDESHYPYETDIKVSGMTCANCVTRVENALNALDGVLARVSLEQGSVHVLSKSPIDVAKLEGAITGAGYYMVKTR